MTEKRTVTDIRRGLVQAADAYHECVKPYSSARPDDGAEFVAWCGFMAAANLANVIAAMLRRAEIVGGGEFAADLAEIVTSAEDGGDCGESAYFANDDVRMAGPTPETA